MANQYISGFTQTWNSGGTTFYAIKVNVTDAASAADSLLYDFQIGGASKGKLAKTGDMTLTSSDAGAAAGPVLTLYRDSATPAASDIVGKLLFQGEDSAGNTEDYAEIYATIADPTSTSEDASILIRSKVAGSMTTHATISSTGWGGMTIMSPVLNGGLSGSAIASISDMEAATSDNQIVTPAKVNNHPGVAKGWCRFNGTGTIVNIIAHNLDSLTDNGTGSYAVNWNLDFSSGNYCAVASSNSSETLVGGSLSAGSTPIFTFSSSGVATDVSGINVVVYGDQ